MKRFPSTGLLTLALLALLTSLSSCASSQTVASAADISGEWDIVQMDEKAIVPAPGQTFPYLGLDASTGRVWGNSGCNLLTGTATIDVASGHIDLSQLGSTRMLCPDMTVEEQVLQALGEVSKFRLLDDGCLLLYDGSKKKGMVLRKR